MRGLAMADLIQRTTRHRYMAEIVVRGQKKALE